MLCTRVKDAHADVQQINQYESHMMQYLVSELPFAGEEYIDRSLAPDFLFLEATKFG
jgi:hypothetical protein